MALHLSIINTTFENFVNNHSQDFHKVLELATSVEYYSVSKYFVNVILCLVLTTWQGVWKTRIANSREQRIVRIVRIVSNSANNGEQSRIVANSGE